MCSWLWNTLPGRASLVMIVSLGLAGCGETSDRLPLAGTVTWQGQPLPKGSILFVPAGEHRGPKVGAPIVNGVYQVEQDRGATSGTYRVEVRADSGEYPHSPTDTRPQTKTPAPKLVIPPEYNSRSKLTAVVTPDRSRFNFDLPLRSN